MDNMRRDPRFQSLLRRLRHPAHQTVNGVTTAKRVAGPVCRDREELKNAPLGWLLPQVQAAEEGLEVGDKIG